MAGRIFCPMGQSCEPTAHQAVQKLVDTVRSIRYVPNIGSLVNCPESAFSSMPDSISIDQDSCFHWFCLKEDGLLLYSSFIFELTLWEVKAFYDKIPGRHCLIWEDVGGILMEIHKIGQYEIIREIGRGGMSNVVYLARDPKLNIEVALKTMWPDPSRAADDKEAIEALRHFRREAEVAIKLKHPGIIKIFNYGTDEESGISFIAMEYLDGGSLKDILRKYGHLSFDETLRIIRMVADTLSYIHGKEVVHCDIKPENIMFLQGHPVIMDFGIARDRVGTISEIEKLVGSVAYMSPERLDGQEYDYREDIYALGIIIYEMLSGENPFNAETLPTTVKNITTFNPKLLSEIRPEISEDFALIVSHMMAKSQNERMKSLNPLISYLQKEIKFKKEEIHDDRSKEEMVHSSNQPKKVKSNIITGSLIVLVILLTSLGLWAASHNRGVNPTLEKSRDNRANTKEGSTNIDNKTVSKPSRAENPVRIEQKSNPKNITGQEINRNPQKTAEEKPIPKPDNTDQNEIENGILPPNPRIAVIIPETIFLHTRVPDPAAETEIIRQLTDEGFNIVDINRSGVIRYSPEIEKIIARDYSNLQKTMGTFADILVVGEAIAESAGDVGSGLISCRARVEVRVIQVNNSGIITAYATQKPGIDTTDILAGKKALEKAGSDVARYLKLKLKEKLI